MSFGVGEVLLSDLFGRLAPSAAPIHLTTTPSSSIHPPTHSLYGMSTEKSPAEATPANITTGDAPPAPTASTSPDSSQTPDADAAREKAALLLQRNVRGKQTRQRQKGKMSVPTATSSLPRYNLILADLA